MAVDFFLKIDGIAGESEKDGMKDNMDIDSFSFGVSQSGSFASGGQGGGAGKANFQDISVVKVVDKTSPKLFEACAAGTHIKEAMLTVRRAGNKPVVYFTIKLTDVIVSSLSNGGASGGSDSVSEQLSLNFAKIEFEYTEQKKDGGAGPKTRAGYDVRKGIKA